MIALADLTLSPERERALKRLQSIPLHVPSITVDRVVDVFEELEYARPIVDLAKALADAKSGEARACAIEAIFAAVERLRKAGR